MSNLSELEIANKGFWLCLVLSVANLSLSIYAKTQLESWGGAVFFLFLGAGCGIGAWLNAKVCALLESKESNQDDSEL